MVLGDVGMESSAARVLMEENRTTFEALLDETMDDLHRRRFRAAAALLQSAARFAWYNHTGIFRSERLERMAAVVGETLALRPAVHDVGDHVVHVISQAYATGGHTRLVWRWIENDRSRVHSVVLIGQQAVPIPRPLAAAVAASGGQIIELGRADSNLLTRAARLRQIATGGPVEIVLHTHPYDVVPSIALRDIPAPVIFVNHADHVFSVGMDVADRVADIRPAGQRLSIAARAVDGAQTRLLPIPLGATPSGERASAREALGLPTDATVLLSIAAGYKYGADRGSHFVDVHLDFVLAHPGVHLVVVGPVDEGRWSEAKAATDGRFRAVGRATDINDYYAAADIYVDSLPFASLTSLLDAAARGVPTIALAELIPGSVLTSDDLSLVGCPVQFADRTTYIEQLDQLVRNPVDRARLGGTLADRVRDDHLPPGWNRHLERVSADALTPVVADNSIGAGAEVDSINLAQLGEALVEFQVVSGLSEPAWRGRLRDAPYLPFIDRWRLVRSLPRGKRLRFSDYLLSDATRSNLKRLRRR